MDNTLIILLAIILFILIILNHITVITTPNVFPNKASCSQTVYGCCPDGVNSKIDYYGKNCPGYNPGPGYLPTPTPKPVPVPLPVPVPAPTPNPPKPIGGCAGTRYGCCPDNKTPKINSQGTNCVLKL
jgi:hypothetical protein